MEDISRNNCDLFNPVHTKAATKLYRATDPPIECTQLHHAFRHISDEIKQISSNRSSDLTDISKGISSTPLSKAKTAPAKNARDNISQLNLATELLKKKPSLIALLNNMFPGDELEVSIFRTNSTFNLNALVNKNRMIEYLADNFIRVKDTLKGNPFTFNDSSLKWEATNDYNNNDFPSVSILEKRLDINTNISKFFLKKRANLNPSNNRGEFFNESSVPISKSELKSSFDSDLNYDFLIISRTEINFEIIDTPVYYSFKLDDKTIRGSKWIIQESIVVEIIGDSEATLIKDHPYLVDGTSRSTKDEIFIMYESKRIRIPIRFFEVKDTTSTSTTSPKKRDLSCLTPDSPEFSPKIYPKK